MKGLVSVRQFTAIGLAAVLSVFCLISFSYSAVWLLAVGLSLEVLAALWVQHTAATRSIREVVIGVEAEPVLVVGHRNPSRGNRLTGLAMARLRETNH
jgi:hypothetical protein